LDIAAAQTKARWVRHQVLEMISGAGHGHIGGSLSATDILVALYHGKLLQYDASNPKWEQRDRFIMSKGHSTESLYCVLADAGFFDVEVLQTYGKSGSILGGHPDHLLPGVEMSTGSLGHGLGIAAGLALAAKLDGQGFLSVAMLGDGECYEGSIWEAAVFGAKNKLAGLVAILDWNKQATLETTEALEPMPEKWKAFGWETLELDGHSFEEISVAWKHVQERKSDKPIILLANTIKGKGVSFMERALNWHHGVPKGDQLAQAREELSIGR
jgi:transketolase